MVGARCLVVAVVLMAGCVVDGTIEVDHWGMLASADVENAVPLDPGRSNALTTEALTAPLAGAFVDVVSAEVGAPVGIDATVAAQAVRYTTASGSVEVAMLPLEDLSGQGWFAGGFWTAAFEDGTRLWWAEVYLKSGSPDASAVGIYFEPQGAGLVASGGLEFPVEGARFRSTPRVVPSVGCDSIGRICDVAVGLGTAIIAKSCFGAGARVAQACTLTGPLGFFCAGAVGAVVIAGCATTTAVSDAALGLVCEMKMGCAAAGIGACADQDLCTPITDCDFCMALCGEIAGPGVCLLAGVGAATKLAAAVCSVLPGARRFGQAVCAEIIDTTCSQVAEGVICRDVCESIGKCGLPACAGESPCPGGSYCANGHCEPCGTDERQCDDGLDNDCDGRVDDADVTCTCIPGCSDHDPCNGSEYCAAGQCYNALPLSCLVGQTCVSGVGCVTQLNPRVSVSPLSGPRGVTFHQPGSGFSPGRGVTLHFRRPDGVETAPLAEVANAAGAYAHSYPSHAGTVLGPWEYWAVDDTSGLRSPTVRFTVTPSLTPVVSVTPLAGPRGTTFEEVGAGFMPNGGVTLHFQRPDGVETATLARIASAAGAFTYSFPSNAGTMLGDWSCWAFDDTTGLASPAVTFTVTAVVTPVVSVFPLTGARGTTFDEPGSGFTPNRGVTLHFRQPDGVEVTLAKNADAAGAYPHSYPSHAGTQLGPWTYWAVDDTTGLSSPMVTFMVTASASPMVSVAPLAGPRGTTFNQPGTGFTPNGGVTLHFLEPNGMETPTLAKIASAAGGYAHDYPSHAGTMLGMWAYWAVDDTTGLSSTPVTFVVTPAVTPSVSVAPPSGARGTIFDEPGTGFSPNGGVTLHFRQPNGVETPTLAKIASAAGTYAHSYPSHAGTMLGDWAYWAFDDMTGLASPIVTFRVTAAVTPMVSVSPARGPRGTTFNEPGTGFTPNGGVTLHFQQPDGVDGTLAKVADGAGNYVHSYLSHANTMVGTWRYWAVDNMTGATSPIVMFTVTVPSVMVAPASGPRGTLFNEPGTGFTLNGGVTLHFQQPDGVDGTVAKLADGAGNYAHSYLSHANTMVGTWRYWALDNTTGATSPTVMFSVTPSPSVSVSPVSGPRGTTFNEPGTGFTPNGGVTLHFQQPDGVDGAVAKVADGAGNYAHSYLSHANTMVGTWRYWAVDNTTGATSPTVMFSVTP